jgi:hypothetical protein
MRRTFWKKIKAPEKCDHPTRTRQQLRALSFCFISVCSKKIHAVVAKFGDAMTAIGGSILTVIVR